MQIELRGGVPLCFTFFNKGSMTYDFDGYWAVMGESSFEVLKDFHLTQDFLTVRQVRKFYNGPLTICRTKSLLYGSEEDDYVLFDEKIVEAINDAFPAKKFRIPTLAELIVASSQSKPLEWCWNHTLVGYGHPNPQFADDSQNIINDNPEKLIILSIEDNE